MKPLALFVRKEPGVRCSEVSRNGGVRAADLYVYVFDINRPAGQSRFHGQFFFQTREYVSIPAFPDVVR
jgi:hypothetical protein